MVISIVNTWYIAPETNNRVAWYLLAGVGTSGAGPAAPPRPAPAMTSLVRTSTWISRIPILAQQETDLESSIWLWNTPCQWSPGWDWLSPQQLLLCPEWLRVSQASLWRCPAAVHRCPGPWFIWLQVRTWVNLNSWASNQHGRQASGLGLKRLGKLGWSKTWPKTHVWKSLRFSCAPWLTNLNHHDWRSCEFLVLLLFSLFNYNKAKFSFSIRSIKLEELLWFTLLEVLQIEIWFRSRCCGNQPMSLEKLLWFHQCLIFL